MAQAVSQSDVREAKLFRNNRSQAVRIPAEFEFAGSRVFIRKEGDRLIIEPQPRPDLIDLLKSLAPLDVEDDFPDNIDGDLLPLDSPEL